MNKVFIFALLGVFIFVVTSFSDSQNQHNKANPTYEGMKNAYFAGGCFWGVEYHFEKKAGVIDVISGYMGGHVENPDYYEVVKGKTGHLEAVRVVYDPNRISFEELTKLFFEIHDMEQTDGQGPDIGSQYLSAIFYNDKKEKETSENVIGILTDKGYKVATSLYEASEFYPAEGYHQNYYARTGKLPYCHTYKKIFD